MCESRITEEGERVEETQMVSAREHRYVNHRSSKVAGVSTEENL